MTNNHFNNIIKSTNRQNNYLIAFFILLALAFSIISSVESNAQFDVQSEQLTISEKDTQDTINKVDPQKPKLNKLKRRGNKITGNENGLDKEFGVKEKNVKIYKKIKSNLVTTNLEASQEVTIGTPDIVNTVSSEITTIQTDKLLMSSANNQVDVTLENVDGGVRQVIVIKDSNQPNRYQFPMVLQEGQKFNKNQDESVTLKDSSGNTVLTILKPWARDKNNKDLQTYYEVEDKLIVQYINFDGAEFPITADPTWCGSAIQKTDWVWKNIYKDRSGRDIWQWSLNIIPTWCGKYSGSVAWAWSTWGELYDKTNWNPSFNWSDRRYGTNKYWSMYNQYVCHFLNPIVTITKNEWNLEPERPHVSLAQTYKSLCNPLP